tara:strand:- start:75 stop:1085 length:1011 start_codon:yes stop_codon:yes gene_type:complete
MSNTVINPYNFVVGNVGAWKELDRATLGSANATIDVTTLANKQYLMMLCSSTGVSSGANTGSQFNADTANNYARRGSNNGGADGTDINFPDMEAGGTDTTPYFQVAYASNIASKEKLLQSSLVAQTGAGAGNAPFRNQTVGKWANTVDPISSYQWITSAAATFNSGSQVVVLGYDPTDIHTTADNFWQELATASGAGATLDTGTFAAKKYLWLQCYSNPTSSSSIRLVFNSDTAGNYAIRESVNGGADATNIFQANSDTLTGTGTAGLFCNVFIINVAGQEKLWISDGQANTAGAGTAGNRKHVSGKWVNTVDSITEIEATSNFGTGSELKVWGHD